MYLIFLDESGSPYPDYDSFRKHCAAGRVPPSAPLYFVLSAVGLQECHLPVVDEWFTGIRKSFLRAGSDSPSEDYEIKGELLYALRDGRTPVGWGGSRSRMLRRRAIWQALTPQQLQQLERSVFDLLRRLAPPIWAVAVKQQPIFRRFRSRTWPPYYWALTYLQQRVAHFVQTAHGAYQRALFVADEISTLSTAAQYDRYLQVRQAINTTAAWPVQFDRYLVDVPVLGKSHLHQALQLADVVSHAVWRHIHSNDGLGWFPQIEPFLAKHWSTGDYSNAGLTFAQ